MDVSDIKFVDDLTTIGTTSTHTPTTFSPTETVITPEVIISTTFSPSESIIATETVVSTTFSPVESVIVPAMEVTQTESVFRTYSGDVFSFVMAVIFCIAIVLIIVRWCYVRRDRIQRACNALAHDVERQAIIQQPVQVLDGEPINQPPNEVQQAQVAQPEHNTVEVHRTIHTINRSLPAPHHSINL